MELALVHDLAECIVGDLTPYCGVSVDEKHKREKEAMLQLAQHVGHSGPYILKLYEVSILQITISMISMVKIHSLLLFFLKIKCLLTQYLTLITYL